MNVILLEPPSVEPVTLAEVWKHLRLTPSGSPLGHPDDAMLTRQIAVARTDCENKTRRAFVKQKLRLIVDSRSERWPWWRGNWRGFGPGPYPECSVELKRPQILGIVAVSYYDATNALVPVDPANYFITDDEPAHLVFTNGFSIPSPYRRSDALRIDYYAGYPAADSPETDFVSRIPEPIKAAILLGMELQYDALAPDQRERLEAAQANLLARYVVQIAI